MKAQVSIAGVMVVVLIVALNAAVARALFAYNAEILIGIALTGLTLQGAVFRLARRRSNRVFWVSFAAFGSLAMASFIWGMTLPRELVAVAYPGQSPRLVNVSQVSALWLGYGRSAAVVLEPWLGHSQRFADPQGVAAVLVRSLVWSTPQLLVALVGGFCALAVAKVGGARFGVLGQSPRGATA